MRCSPIWTPRSRRDARTWWSWSACPPARASDEATMKTRRYQLRKEAVAIIERGHPWIFREQMSSAASALEDGDALRLFDGQNRVVGYGLFESEGAIAIRVLRRGADAPDAAWVVDTL